MDDLKKHLRCRFSASDVAVKKMRGIRNLFWIWYWKNSARCCGKRVEGLFKKAAIRCRFQALQCCCSNSRESFQENKIGCRFLRGAGFGYIVGRFFEKPCRFSALNVAVRGWREKTRKDLRQAEEQRRKRDAKTFSERCRFGGPKVAVRLWEEFSPSKLAPNRSLVTNQSDNWLRFGASSVKKRASTVWHQFWCRVQRSNRAMASILTPLKNISPDPYIFRLPMTYHLRGISIFFRKHP